MKRLLRNMFPKRPRPIRAQIGGAGGRKPPRHYGPRRRNGGHYPR